MAETGWASYSDWPSPETINRVDDICNLQSHSVCTVQSWSDSVITHQNESNCIINILKTDFCVCTQLTGLKLQSLLDLLTCCPVPATVILLVRSDRPLGASLLLSSLTFWMSFCCRGLMASKLRGRPALSFCLSLRGLLL